MQALNNLAIENATPRSHKLVQTWRSRFLRGTCSFADVRTAMEELTEAQQHQDRLQEELKRSRGSLDMALMDVQENMSTVNESRERHDVVCRRLQAQGLPRRDGKRTMPTTESQLIGIDVDGRQRSFETAEEDLNDSLRCMGQLITDTAGATTLSRGVPDRQSNEVRYLQGVLEKIEEFQRRGFSRGTTEITLVERQQISSPGSKREATEVALEERQKKKFTC